ncbi:hypothetical protein BDZ97DRAFT_1807914 [Flammula alnicola]|nr:hypothetical protein BDZ97DRAFT_1807914 [Flammula alnicola]
MSKPTLVQSLLKQPSQTYRNADTNPRKEYYSTRQDMMRIAQESAHSKQGVERNAVVGMARIQGWPAEGNGTTATMSTTPMTEKFKRSTTASTQVVETQRRSQPPLQAPEELGEEDSDLDMFFTPNTSPRTSMASSVATITFPSSRRPSRRSLTNLKTDSDLPVKLPPDPPPQAKPSASSVAVPSTRTPSTSTSDNTRARHALSSASSLSSTSLDAHSVFSDYVGSAESTLLTTPYQSDSGEAGTYAKGKSSSAIRSTTTDARWRNQQYTDEDWARDIRWLVPPTSTSSTPTAKNTPGSSNTKIKLIPSSTIASAINSVTATTVPADPVVGSGSGKKKSLGSHLGVGHPDGEAAITDSVASAKGKEKAKEKTTKPTYYIASHGMPLPPTSTASTKTYAPPRQPHTFSAFASMTSSTTTTTTVTSITGSSQTTNSNSSGVSRSTSFASNGSSITVRAESGNVTYNPTTTNTHASGSASNNPSQSYNNPRRNPSPSPSSSDDKSSGPNPQQAPPQPPAQTQTASTNRRKPSVSKPGSTLIGGMDALMEEDEDGLLTPRMEAKRLSNSAVAGGGAQDALGGQSLENGWDWGLEYEVGGAAMSRLYAAIGAGEGGDPTLERQGGVSGSQSSQGTSRSRSLRHTATTAPNLRRRRSRSLDDSSSNSNSNSNSPSISSSASTSRTRSHAPPKTLTAEVQALVSSFVEPGELSSKGTQGYTSLVLPRAPQPMDTSFNVFNAPGHIARGGWRTADGKVDLTRSGVAQTTMASVEVVRGLGSRGGSSIRVLGGMLGFGLGRKRSVSAGSARGPAPVSLPSTSGKGARRASTDAGGPAAPSMDSGMAQFSPAPMHSVNDATTTPLGFTSYRSPPDHVPSGSVLVQVWAVGVDGVDGRLVGVRFGKVSGYGGVGELAQRSNETEEDSDAEEQEEQDADDSEGNRKDEGKEDDADETTPTKKGPLAALGRSISLRLSRGGSAKQKAKKQADLQRSASAAVPKSAPKSAQQQQQQRQHPGPRQISLPKRSLSFSLKRSNTGVSHASTVASGISAASPNGKDDDGKANGRSNKKTFRVADVGYIPGRSFVGRVLECGWDVSDEVVRKGEWVVGLLDVRKGGALTEFIVVDRHRVHRVPLPRKGTTDDPMANALAAPVWHTSSPKGVSSLPLSLEELALLPLCGLPAYRAVRTFTFAFSSMRDGHSTPGTLGRPDLDFWNGANSSARKAMSLTDHEPGYRRRALVLRGHDGVGAMAVQILVKRGWRVSVHVPFSSVPAHAPQGVAERFMHGVEDLARDWGADEVIFDDGEGGGLDDGRAAAVRVLESLREDGDVFDAVLDTVGGKVVWEAGERLLKSHGLVTIAAPSQDSKSSLAVSKRRGVGQFTTLVGHTPERVIPSARDNFGAGIRALRMGSSGAASGGASASVAEEGNTDIKAHGKVGYAWVSVAQDVDWEGEDVSETLGTVLRLALENGVRPVVEGVEVDGESNRPRVVPFEKAPFIFVDNGPLSDGGTVVVKIAG